MQVRFSDFHADLAFHQSRLVNFRYFRVEHLIVSKNYSHYIEIRRFHRAITASISPWKWGLWKIDLLKINSTLRFVFLNSVIQLYAKVRWMFYY